jgi:hypothetical protein
MLIRSQRLLAKPQSKNLSGNFRSGLPEICIELNRYRFRPSRKFTDNSWTRTAFVRRLGIPSPLKPMIADPFNDSSRFSDFGPYDFPHLDLLKTPELPGEFTAKNG